MNLPATVQPALWTLRVWWKTTALIVIVGSLAAGAVIPITSLSAWQSGALIPRIGFPPLEAPESAVPSSSVALPLASIRREALSVLFHLLAAVAGGVLLVAILTILAAIWARAPLRAREIAIRRGVGASRRQLRGAGLLEGGLIGLAILSIGTILGSSATHLAIDNWPGVVGSRTIKSTLAALAALLAVTILGTTVSSQPRRSGVRNIRGSGPALELVIPALQLGMSLAVLTTSTLIARHANRVLGPALQRSTVSRVFTITTSDTVASSRARRYSRILSDETGLALGELSITSPGVLFGLGNVDVEVTQCGNCYSGGFYTPWEEDYAIENAVSAGTFAQLGLHFIAGRSFAPGDTWRAPSVVVVNQSLAKHFENAEALGKKLKIGRSVDWYTVVGVVEDQPPIGFGSGLLPPNAVYLNVLQHPTRSFQLLIGRHGDGEPANNPNKRLRSALPPNSSLAETTAARLLMAEEAPLVWFSRAFSSEGWVMMAIAFLGTFTLMRVWVESALYELGVRMAVGARRSEAFWWVVRRALAVAVGGTLIGLWFGLVIWGALPEVISGLEPWDSHAVLVFGSLLAGACFSGAVVPAWQKTAYAPIANIAGRGK
jgi:hypothetical protein